MSAQVIAALRARAGELETEVTSEQVRFLDGLTTNTLTPYAANVFRTYLAGEFRKLADACEAGSVATPASAGSDVPNATTQGEQP